MVSCSEDGRAFRGGAQMVVVVVVVVVLLAAGTNLLALLAPCRASGRQLSI